MFLGDSGTITNRFPRIFVNQLVLKGVKRDYKAHICLCYASIFTQYLETVEFLHPKELEYYFTLKFEQRIKSFLAGRYAAKKAVSFFSNDKNLECILIGSGIFNQPIVVHPNETNIQVSISHCDNLGAAIAFSEELPMGIDIERINADRKDVLESQMTGGEKDLFKLLPCSHEAACTLFWTAKEALSKILKTGLMIPFHICEINQIVIEDGIVYSFFKNFPQYCTASLIFHPYVCSITYPKKVVLDIKATEELLRDFKQLIID